VIEVTIGDLEPALEERFLDELEFHLYDLVEPTASIDELLAKVDRDPTSIFWG
jgi:hypothetical protein